MSRLPMMNRKTTSLTHKLARFAWSIIHPSTKQGNVVPSMQAKFKQINHFLTKSSTLDGPGKTPPDVLNVIDCWVRESFISQQTLYHWLTNLRGLNVKLHGIDSNQHVISFCTRTARTLEYDGMSLRVVWLIPFPPPTETWHFNRASCLRHCDRWCPRAWNWQQGNSYLVGAVLPSLCQWTSEALQLRRSPCAYCSPTVSPAERFAVNMLRLDATGYSGIERICSASDGVHLARTYPQKQLWLKPRKSYRSPALTTREESSRGNEHLAGSTKAGRTCDDFVANPSKWWKGEKEGTQYSWCCFGR